ncbi:MAG: YkgJ family cysteine cluster protein [Calditrichaeota bacterium]|nr:MAG: YkgJ family cysteine cluster protein [Calditrichota bacterium]
MQLDQGQSAEGSESEHQLLPAGDFSDWLRKIRQAVSNNSDMDVPCGDCCACCSSFQFITIRPQEKQTLARIPKPLRIAAPGRPPGDVLLGYDQNGFCPMLRGNRCSIYDSRPLTCRNYDCRLFAAAGVIPEGDQKIAIARQVSRWQFSYPTPRDKEEQLAVKSAVLFIQEHADCFPGGLIPHDEGQLALLAIKVFEIFLPNEALSGQSDVQIAAAVVQACKKFETRQW